MAADIATNDDALGTGPAPAPGSGAVVVTAGATLAAGIVHAAMTPAHVAEWPLEGRLFAALAAVQVLLGATLLVRRTRLLLAAIVATNVGPVAGWIWSRTTGFPFGPGEGVAEEVGWADALTAGAEVLAVLLALRLLLAARSTAAPAGDDPVLAAAGRAGRAPAPAWALGVAMALVVGSAALVASPEGQHAHGGDAHGGAGHDDGHGDDHGAAPALTRPLEPGVRAELAQELTVARDVALKYPTVAAAKAAKLQQAGQFVPGSAAHFVDISVGMSKTFDLEKPLAWLYSGTDDDSVLVGVMYYLATDAAPEGFAGPLDLWHQHTGACYRIKPDGQIFVPFSPDHDGTRAECEAAKGEYIDQTGWMVHAWVAPGWDSPQGVFSHANPDILCADGRSTVADEAKGCIGT